MTAQQFAQVLLGRWETASGNLSVTFETDVAVLMEGPNGGEVPYELDPERRRITFKMPAANLEVTARLSDDGTVLRLQSSRKPGELVVLKRIANGH